ncbi:MucBP domain-containing protein [Listeria booriae]|uniref:MucBP domain-containing protein n=1 Tax=Listeria booriae TaxID=1552123 RepID=UPI00162716DE|nr:MucBP domain-containing protein [Listeria booriae]MBC2256714.1 LPXTG cell wall anchor domain-containing protein [Listeria booriae]
MIKRRGKTRIIGMVAVWTGMSLLAPLHPIALTTSGEDAQIPTRAVAATSEEVQDWMPDAKLRQSVQLALGLAEENEITKEGMRQLTTLENINASSLTGLEYAVNLKSFQAGFRYVTDTGNYSVYKSPITDFSPLYNLSKLESIALSGDFSTNVLRALFSHVSSVTGIVLFNNAVLQDLNWMDVIPRDYTFGFTLSKGSFYGDEVQVTDFSGLDNRSLYGIRIDSPNIKNIPLSTIDPDHQVVLFHGQVSDYSRLGDMKLVDISAQDIRHVPAKIVGDRVVAKNPIQLPEGFPAMKAGHFRNYFNSFDEVKQELSISVERLLYINQPHFTDTFGYSYLRDGKTFNAGGAISMDIEGLPVTVRYTDTEGTSIHADTTLTGLFTEPYTSTAVSVPGYALKTSPANATGTYSEKAQTVTYVYEKIATGPVTVQYVDEQGVSIAPTEVLTGDYGKAYTSKAQHIAGYVLIETPTNATGVFTEQAQTVTYVYHKQTAQPVTVQYVDESGASIALQETLTGEFGRPYTSEAKKLTGYVLTEAPANATGVFTNQAQTVRYRYQKIALPAPDTDSSSPDTSTNGPGDSPSTQQPLTSDTNSKGTTLAPSATTQRQAIPPVSEVPVVKKAIETLPSTGDKNASSGILVAGISSLLAGVWLLRRRS